MRHFLCKHCNCIESIEAPHSVAYCTVCEGKLTELIEAPEPRAPQGQARLPGYVPGARPLPVVGDLEKILSYRIKCCAGCKWHPDVCRHCEQSLQQ
jgi:hypothetical protein